MGILRKITGAPDKKLLETGLLGRGIITEVRPTGTTFQSGNGLVQRACVFTVQVSLDGKEPYMATCKQRIVEVQIPQFQAGSTTVAVRVNPEDPTDIALDLATATGRSRFAVHRAFTHVYGMPPSDYQRQLRLREARALIAAGTPISEAAALAGFADQSHLSRWFVRYYGVTPGRYARAANPAGSGR